MKYFNNNTEKMEFLKKYGLVSKTATDLPIFYYYASSNDIPVICEIIGYEDVFDTWAVITINVNNQLINIHSDYLLDMKKNGTSFYKKNSPTHDVQDALDSYIVFDLETTGTNYNKNEIIEIAAIKCVGQTIYEFNELVSIQSILPLNIVFLTGITNEMLYDAKPIETVLPEFLDFIGNCKLVGHNIKAFDIHFINKACRDLNLSTIKNEIIDTLTLSRNILPNLENHKLSTICDYYGIDSSNAHRALSDCYMCNECYQNLLKSNYSEYDTSLNIESGTTNFQNNIRKILKDIISELELPENGLILQKNRGTKKITFSICINEPPFPATKDDLKKINSIQSILNIEEQKNSIILTISNNANLDISYPENIRYKEKGNLSKIYFPIGECTIYEYIKSIIYSRIKRYVSSAALFGCCSKFNECSDAKKCVHENKLYSTACMYRLNLESGKIFYGKNRNID